MKQVIKETVKYMWRSEKNRLFMFISTALVILYTVFVLPNISGENEIDVEMLEREMSGNVVQFEGALDEGLLIPSIMTGTTAYASQRQESVSQRQLLTALKQGDVKRYIEISYRPETSTTTEMGGLSQLAFNLFGYDIEQPYQTSKYNYYLDEVKSLSFHIVHERTSLQQVHLFLIGFGPILMLMGLIFLISDIHVKDRSLLTLKIGVPMSWQKYSFVQALTAFGFVTLFYIALFAVFILFNGLLHGFGTLNLPVGFYEANFEYGFLNQDNYQIQTIGWFLVQAAPYLILLGYLFTRLNSLFSIWTKQSVVTMVLGLFVLLFQFIYFGNDSQEVLGIDIRWLPQTYFDFGKVLTGRLEQQLLVSMPDLYRDGLIVLGITVVIVEVCIYASSKMITRQKFVG